ncbi:NAD(P)/FAD-dependent oxidoreductase [Rubritalea marina]|uniref:NAD(P)/FAD-dependent oxidoreductase n=1 Tax=Rubritalea marina TaxID=361055 RepID=UPI00036E2CB4|nr:NAD(P)/FAD-dependent oxidoreductase [Rubritalea marina]
MSPNKNPVIIVGAGLSGLSCALKLQEAGTPYIILEASDCVGGRARTDNVDGFLLDRGFQVFLSAYPKAGKLLNLEALELCKFEPGALVFDGQKMQRVMDVFRRPLRMLGSALSPIGSLTDKLRVAQLRFQALGTSQADIARHQDLRTVEFLRSYGFSECMIDGFFRSFYGGIFLENELRTSSRMFEFTFKMFTSGYATLPANGMSAIPKQLADRLPRSAISLNTPVQSVTTDSVTLLDGASLDASQVILATDASTASHLVPNFESIAPSWRAVTNFYFSADQSPLKEAIIALNGSGDGLVNNLCVPSDVSPSYAPAGKSLISVAVLGERRDPHLRDIVIAELREWFGDSVMQWQHLRTDIIKHALPEQAPSIEPPKAGYLNIDGIWLCGDHTSTASIEGAIMSGQATAEQVIARLAAP